MACGADTFGTTLMDSLTSDASFSIPTTVIPAEVSKLSIVDLTSGTVAGTGAFDKIMVSLAAHLKNEYDKNRITGAEYTKAFIAATELALSQGASFTLACERQYWDTLLLQQQTIAAKLQVENLLAEYAIKKLQLAKLSSEYCASEFNVNTLLPKQAEMLSKQIDGQETSNQIAEFNVSTLLPKQAEMLAKQIAGQEASNQIAAFNVNTLLPKQAEMLTEQIDGQEASNQITKFNVNTLLPKQAEMLTRQIAGQETSNQIAAYNLANMLPEQLKLVKEQFESARAQTKDTRSDGSAIEGSIGAQKLLHAQQVTAYVQDSKLKVAKIFSDSWITQKTLNEDVPAPAQLINDSVNTVLSNLRASVNI